MTTRPLALIFSLLTLVAAALPMSSASGAPEAHLLRIDPRAGLRDGTPVLTAALEIVEPRRVSDVLQPCAHASGGAAVIACWGEQMEKPGALWQAFPFPEQNVHFSVRVGDADRLARFVDKTPWAQAQSQRNVGTAWLVALDSAASMGDRFGDARAIAHEVIEQMLPNDVLDLMFFDDTQVVLDTKWRGFAARAELGAVLNDIKSVGAPHGRERALLAQVKSMTEDAFGALWRTLPPDSVPLHQAFVFLSNGIGHGDTANANASAEALHEYLVAGRFSESSGQAPKMPLPVVSVWLPIEAAPADATRRADAQLMQAMANPEVGGFFDVVPRGGGAAKAKAILAAVRSRFNAMWLVHFSAGCVNPGSTQSFRLGFENTHPAIVPDATFTNVPVGVDASLWPLDVDIAKTVKAAEELPTFPGGQVTVYGDFCWGEDKQRAEGYFLPKAPPAGAPRSQLRSKDDTRKALQELLAVHAVGKALATSDAHVTLAVPDAEGVLDDEGGAASVHLVVYDALALRASAVDGGGVLTLRAVKKPFPLALVAGVAGLVVVAALLVVALASMRAARRASLLADAYATPGAYVTHTKPHVIAVSAADPLAATAAVGGGLGPSPYVSHATHATLSGANGQFAVHAGPELRVGRDPAVCSVFLSEPRVSAMHATLKFEEGRLLVRDDGSNNGTWIFGTRVPAGVWTPVPPGATVRFGPVEFTARLEA